MANRIDKAAVGIVSEGTLGGAFNAEKSVDYPANSGDTQATDIQPSDLHKKNAAPKADSVPAKRGTSMSRHTPDLLFDKDRV